METSTVSNHQTANIVIATHFSNVMEVSVQDGYVDLLLSAKDGQHLCIRNVIEGKTDFDDMVRVVFAFEFVLVFWFIKAGLQSVSISSIILLW